MARHQGPPILSPRGPESGELAISGQPPQPPEPHLPAGSGLDGAVTAPRSPGGCRRRDTRGRGCVGCPGPGHRLGQQPARARPEPTGPRGTRGLTTGGPLTPGLALQRLHPAGNPGALPHVRRCPGAGAHGAGGVRRQRRQAGCPWRLPGSGRPPKCPSPHAGGGRHSGPGLWVTAGALVQAAAAAATGAAERKAGSSCSRRLSSRSTFSSRLL